MSDARVVQRPRLRLGTAVFLAGSLLLHAAVLLYRRGAAEDPEAERPFQLPTQLEFGLADMPPGGGNATTPPPPKPIVHKAPKRARVKAPPDPNAYALKHAKSAAEPAPPAAASGEGEDPDAEGVGIGDGMGPGSGYAPAGATIALNVDLARVRQTALVLETRSLLDIIPEWQLMLAGSGVDPLQDLERVFVASPTLERASVVVAANHHLPRMRLQTAVNALASEQGKTTAFRARQGFDVADWYNRGPTERVIALTGDDQFTITRAGDLERVLNVAASLAHTREGQGFKASELAARGGLLAMQDKEAVALWVEGVRKYAPSDAEGVPSAMRMSIYHVDQFNTELRVRGQYSSKDAAASALTTMDALRVTLADHPKVVFLGLKSALERAQIEQSNAALTLRVRLTLHQTRYLMRFVTRALRPRNG